jgi:hypothetical protein
LSTLIPLAVAGTLTLPAWLAGRWLRAISLRRRHTCRLQESAAKNDDEVLRHSFLEHVSAHREILSEYNEICEPTR